MNFCSSNQQLPMHKLEPSMITGTTSKQPNLEMFVKQRKYIQGLKKTTSFPVGLPNKPPPRGRKFCSMTRSTILLNV